MTVPTRREHTELSRALKEQAFKENPMFARDQVRKMSTEFSVDIIDEIPSDIAPEVVEEFKLSSSITTIAIGMQAVRYTDHNSCKPAYLFDVWQSITRELSGAELHLGEQAWDTVRGWFFTPDEIQALHEDEAVQQVVATAAVREQLYEDGAECYEYHHRRFSFDTSRVNRTDGIHDSYQRVVTVMGDDVEITGTHVSPVVGEIDINTPDGWISRPLYDATPGDDTPGLSFADTIETYLAFEDLADGTGLSDEASYGLFVPHQDKVAEMLFLVNCLKQRQIPIN